MKKSFYYLTLFVALMMGATVFSSCGDDDSEQPLPPEPEGIPYFAWDDAENKLVKKYLTEKIDTIGKASFSHNMHGGWYFVERDNVIDIDLNILGDVHLILADGASLDVQGTVDGQTGRENISIYAQSEYPEKRPQISVTSSQRSTHNGVNGNLIVNGGMVKVNSNGYGSYAVHGNLTVYNGFVELNGAYGVSGDLNVKGCQWLRITGKDRAVCGTIFFEVPYMFLLGLEDTSSTNPLITSGTSSNAKRIEAVIDGQGGSSRRY